MRKLNFNFNRTAHGIWMLNIAAVDNFDNLFLPFLKTLPKKSYEVTKLNQVVI